MTTKVIVEANHGWPVDVKAFDPTTGQEIALHNGRVPAGEVGTFYLTSLQDLRLHEIQPHEIAADPAATDASAAG